MNDLPDPVDPPSSPAMAGRRAGMGPPDVLVLGAGLAGLAAAWELLEAGARVTVVDRSPPGSGTSHVAAGMLAPVVEAEPDHPEQLALGLAALRAWPAFAARLRAASGHAVPVREQGTLAVARDRDEAEALIRFAAIRERLGVPVTSLLPSAARRLEPALAPTLRAALEVRDDHAVDPRAVVAALAAAVLAAGGELRCGVAVERLQVRGGRATGVALADGATIAAAAVVVAAGAWSSQLPGLPDAARIPVRPVKGQLLVLRDPAGPGLVERVVRFGSGYLVPRDDGRYVLGATTEEQGFDRSLTAWAVHDLLRDGAELVPGILELRIEETLAGLRPTTPDGLAAIGPSATVDGLWWCTGHHRNGVLLASLTGSLLATAVGARPAPADADPALLRSVDPRRLEPTAEPVPILEEHRA